MDMEACWEGLLQQLRGLPADFRGELPPEQRFDSLGKDLCLTSLYALCPPLRKRVASCGGLAQLWSHCHRDPTADPETELAWQQGAPAAALMSWLRASGSYELYIEIRP
ncbi:unnamed protein product [Symbiodinium natans]|uniref:Uncharacterized protein n=1 Tax=Symbiodinium natans TaxID=878477 RepID=A0A812TPZ7_9DINO|nr:unnamed protein product [Symbiodinium natans]